MSDQATLNSNSTVTPVVHPVINPISSSVETLDQSTTSRTQPMTPPTMAASRQPLIRSVQTPPQRKLTFLPKIWHKVVFILLLLVLAVGASGAAMAYYTYGVLQDMQAQATEMQTVASTARDQFKAQNLPGTEASIKDMAERLKTLRATYEKLSFYNVIPIARSYYQDGIHGLNAADAGIGAGVKSLGAITPYADVLGFKGEGTFTGGTTEDRLKVILDTLPKLNPVLNDITADLETVKSEIAQIDANRYPETFQGMELRSKILQAQAGSETAASVLTEFRPIIERLPEIAGANGKRKKYFVIFQNNNELRPTGGFLTAYAIIYIENGKVTPEKSTNIYDLDKKFNKKIPIPAILGKYLTTEKSWNLRDMNTSPDFKTSMDQFLTNYKLVPDEPKDIDGIIALDTHVLVDLLKVLGPVEVPGYLTFSAENTTQGDCNCPQVIYELSNIITRPTPYIREDRKGVLGPLMRALLTKAYTAPKTTWPELFEKARENVEQRHVQMYFFDQQSQDAATAAKATGALVPDKNAEDFLAVIDANLGGAKSNLFITSEAQHEVSSPSNGVITKKLTLTYKNSRRGDNCNLEAGLLCLNATLRDWNRIYVPKGSKLISSNGYRQGTMNQYDEGEFTVFDGEFTLDPNSQTKLQLEYTVPYTDTKNYKVKLWKQGGITALPTIFDVNGNEEKVDVLQDTLFQTKF